MTELVTVCPQCGAVGAGVIERARSEAMCDEFQSGGVFRCRFCGWESGMWLDGGEIDLEAAREQAEASGDNFWIYEVPAL